MRKHVGFFGVILLVLLVDQASKAWVVNALAVGESRQVIRNVLYLTLTHNTGIAFGLMSGVGWFTTPLAILVMLGILWYRIQDRTHPTWREIGLGLLFGGALSNLIDRLRLGYVVDMFDFQIWPVFNVADSCISIAIVILLVSQFFHKSEEEKTTEWDGRMEGWKDGRAAEASEWESKSS
jgi:signal peptidase II